MIAFKGSRWPVVAAVFFAHAGCTEPNVGRQKQKSTAELYVEIETVCGLPLGALTGKAVVPNDMVKISCAVREAEKRNVAIRFVSDPLVPDH